MNSFGKIFRVTIFGESHGYCVGVVIDGVTPGIDICEEDFEKDLKRRLPETRYITQRKEKDKVNIISGYFNGKTTGAPLTLILKNKDVDSRTYENILNIPRPSHADFTSKIKYKGFNDFRGGGIFSGRLTASIVLAGVVAKKMLNKVEFESKVISIGGEKYPGKKAEALLAKTAIEKDTLGAIIQTKIKNIPIGLGEPFFDGLESYLSHILFSIPGLKAIEFGEGINSASIKGSQYIDKFIDKNGKTLTNNSGGINGGISNGNEIIFNCYFHPPVTMNKELEYYDFSDEKVKKLALNFRYDICYGLRTPVIVEASASIALIDLYLLFKSQN